MIYKTYIVATAPGSLGKRHCSSWVSGVDPLLYQGSSTLGKLFRVNIIKAKTDTRILGCILLWPGTQHVDQIRSGRDIGAKRPEKARMMAAGVPHTLGVKHLRTIRRILYVGFVRNSGCGSVEPHRGDPRIFQVAFTPNFSYERDFCGTTGSSRNL